MLGMMNEYLAKYPRSFHTPSHKSNDAYWKKINNILDYDLTELPETGSLFDAEGLTALAEDAAAKAFGTKGTFFSPAGCSHAIQAMLRLALSEGGKLLCSRIIHRSAVNAMALLDIYPVFIRNDSSAGKDFLGRLDPQRVSDSLKADNEIKAVYLTSPDYFGVLSDITGLSDVCRQYNIPLLVDNAHGSHLLWLGKNQHPLSFGADMSADSAHKTLPVLTGGAWLQINNEKYLNNARSALSLFSSTSPSYMTMLSLDMCREWLQREGREAFSRLEKRLKPIKTQLRQMGFTFPEGIIDPVRLAFSTAAAGANANSLAAFLRKKSLEVEYSDDTRIIMIPSPMNTESDFTALEGALSEYKWEPERISLETAYNIPEMLMRPHEALLSKSETISIENALGRISAENACLCPPGIPAVIMGEKIDSATLEILRHEKIKNIKVVKL